MKVVTKFPFKDSVFQSAAYNNVVQRSLPCWQCIPMCLSGIFQAAAIAFAFLGIFILIYGMQILKTKLRLINTFWLCFYLSCHTFFNMLQTGRWCHWQQNISLCRQPCDWVSLTPPPPPPQFRYHCHTLPPVSLRAVETVTRSKVLWIGTQVPSCQPTNCQVSGTLPTPTEGNTATTTLLHTHNKVCHHRVRDSCRKHLMKLTAIAQPSQN